MLCYGGFSPTKRFLLGELRIVLQKAHVLKRKTKRGYALNAIILLITIFYITISKLISRKIVFIYFLLHF